MFAYRLVLWNCFEKGSVRSFEKSPVCVCRGVGVCVCECVCVCMRVHVFAEFNINISLLPHVK